MIARILDNDLPQVHSLALYQVQSLPLLSTEHPFSCIQTASSVTKLLHIKICFETFTTTMMMM